MEGGITLSSVLVFCDSDSNGKIIESLVGKNIIPARQFDHFFFIADDDTFQDIDDYKIENGKLVLKEAE
jgi:hypothetical protein